MPDLEMPTKPIDRMKPCIISVFKRVLDGKEDFIEKHLTPGVLISALLLEKKAGMSQLRRRRLHFGLQL